MLGFTALNAAAIKTETNCEKTDVRLQFDCLVIMKQGDDYINNAEVLVGADMPSMPMAHNVKPVSIEKSDNDGEYYFVIQLEMSGEWKFIYNFIKPKRDKVFEKLDF
jgi:hypothetical protein